MAEYERHEHEFPPLYNADSRVLILGSFPSVKSREIQFYYGHPQNRFWNLIAKLTGEEPPQSVEEKTALVRRHRIALWDVIDSCEIKGSSDSSIRNVVPTDLSVILDACSIQRIFANGKLAEKLYVKYQLPLTGMPVTGLPSTSPANAAWTFGRLLEKWKIVGEYCF